MLHAAQPHRVGDFAVLLRAAVTGYDVMAQSLCHLRARATTATPVRCARRRITASMEHLWQAVIGERPDDECDAFHVDFLRL